MTSQRNSTPPATQGIARAPQQAPARHRPLRRRMSPFLLLVIGTATLLLVWSGVAFLATVVATVEVAVAPHQPSAPPAGAGNSLPAGATVDVVATAPSTAFTVKHGGPHKDTGRQLFRIQVDPTQTSKLAGTFAWLDPMNSPFSNGFVEVGLYYQVATAGCDSGAGDVILLESAVTFDELEEAGTNLCFRPADGVQLLTDVVAAARLSANGAPARSYLYVIASILNAGHNAPPGQQPDLGSLEFLFMAR